MAGARGSSLLKGRPSESSVPGGERAVLIPVPRGVSRYKIVV